MCAYVCWQSVSTEREDFLRLVNKEVYFELSEFIIFFTSSVDCLEYIFWVC